MRTCKNRAYSGREQNNSAHTISIEQVKNQHHANARRGFGISAALPRYTRQHDDNDYLRLRYTGVRRALGALEFTTFSTHVVSADLQRFTARQDLAKLSPFPVLPTGCSVLLGRARRIHWHTVYGSALNISLNRP